MTYIACYISGFTVQLYVLLCNMPYYIIVLRRFSTFVFKLSVKEQIENADC